MYQGVTWSVRQLDRQIQSMLYERTALSRRKMSVIAKAHEKPITLKPEDEIKDPYILEFLGLKDEYSVYSILKHTAKDGKIYRVTENYSISTRSN